MTDLARSMFLTRHGKRRNYGSAFVSTTNYLRNMIKTQDWNKFYLINSTPNRTVHSELVSDWSAFIGSILRLAISSIPACFIYYRWRFISPRAMDFWRITSEEKNPKMRFFLEWRDVSIFTFSSSLCLVLPNGQSNHRKEELRIMLQRPQLLHL